MPALMPLLRLLRPHQWLKNGFVFVGLLFGHAWTDPVKLGQALAAFAAFCLLASAVYVMNDLIDREQDRLHPKKKSRPLAAGTVSVASAGVLAAVLLLAGGSIAWLWAGSAPWIFLVYVVLNIAYSFGLKRVAYLDVLSIAGGFELRVLAGAYAANVPPSAYLLIVTFLLASFLGLGKRMHELVQQGRSGSTSSRKVLAQYNRSLVGVLLWVTSIATVAAYVVYTLDPQTRAQFGTDFLVVTSAFALFGVLRFVHLVRSRPDAESPTEEMLRDVPFLVNGVLGVVTLIAIIYLS